MWISRCNYWGLVILLYLGRNAVLGRFELTIETHDLSLAHEWIHQTLRTMTSPLFNEFVTRLLGR